MHARARGKHCEIIKINTVLLCIYTRHCVHCARIIIKIAFGAQWCLRTMMRPRARARVDRACISTSTNCAHVSLRAGRLCSGNVSDAHILYVCTSPPRSFSLVLYARSFGIKSFIGGTDTKTSSTHNVQHICKCINAHIVACISCIEHIFCFQLVTMKTKTTASFKTYA